MVGRNSMFSRPLDRRRQARGQPGWETKDESNSRQLGGISLRLACVLDSVTSLAGHGSAGVCLQSLAVWQHAHMSQTCDGMTEDRVCRLRVSRGLLVLASFSIFCMASRCLVRIMAVMAVSLS
jgi:hypothetical protein